MSSQMIFFEGLTIDYWQSGFTAGPGGPAYDDRQVYAYHVYCPLSSWTAQAEKACEVVDEYFFSRRRKDVERVGGGMMMTEFGAAEDIRGDLVSLERTVAMADQWAQSWMYWQLKYYQDITTCTPEGESLYFNNGTACVDKLQILSRTYPQIIAGSNASYSFNHRVARFDLSYTPIAAAEGTTSSDTERTTTVYFNREIHYPHGIFVSAGVTSGQSGVVAVSCVGGGLFNVMQLGEVAAGERVVVSAEPCSRIQTDKPCTCMR